jgi:hypothetical protein
VHVEIARAEGMAKRGDEWFPLSLAVVFGISTQSLRFTCASRKFDI